MTLDGLEGYYPIASLFKYDISYLWLVARSLYICTAVTASCWTSDDSMCNTKKWKI